MTRATLPYPWRPGRPESSSRGRPGALAHRFARGSIRRRLVSVLFADLAEVKPEPSEEVRADHRDRDEREHVIADRPGHGLGFTHPVDGEANHGPRLERTEEA